MEELMKVPDSVIIQRQQDIIKHLRKEVEGLKKHKREIIEKAKEREEQWKAYTEELLNAIRVLEADEDEEAWGSAYDAIFGEGYCRIVMECVPNFDWYDPDASYQDDVCAFVWALEELMDNIKVV